ncbi:MAG: type II toxin-antitoxin system VapC family toxin [Nevskia sp.]|nr:type II toxin-antitoxin system VapC family toxin [Nevskia sp.]
MILVDTSVWIEHLRKGVPALAGALESGQVLIHPFVVGELACGSLGPGRLEFLALLRELSAAPVASDEEALGFIEAHRLAGRGIGYVDVHLLAAATLAGDAHLWTRDRRLAAVAQSLSLDWNGARR